MRDARSDDDNENPQTFCPNFSFFLFAAAFVLSQVSQCFSVTDARSAYKFGNVEERETRSSNR